MEEGGHGSGVQSSVVWVLMLSVTKNGDNSVNLVSTSYSVGAVNRVPTGWLRAERKGKPCLGTKRLTAWRSQSVPSTRRMVRV